MAMQVNIGIKDFTWVSGKQRICFGKPIRFRSQTEPGEWQDFYYPWDQAEPYSKLFINHEDIMAGGEMVFEMTSKPVRKVTADEDLPGKF